MDLLGEKAFDDLSVAEIARRAGLSVGGFYARFDGKMALLHYLQGAVLGGLLEKAREIFSPEATASLARAGLRCLDGPMARCGP